MVRLRRIQQGIAIGYRDRDDRLVALATSNSLSRHDMALATGLAKSRIDQIIRETYTRDQAHAARANLARVQRHMPPNAAR
jgi:hypothetical protein